MEKINEKDKLKISEKDLKFDNKDIIGSGVFGQVFLAHIMKTNEKVAVKKVFQDRRYKNRELSIMKELNHPNIIDYKEAFFDEETKTLNIVMEYAEEGDLENKVKENLKRRMHFSENTIWEWIIQILEGLKYLHDNNL